MSKQYTINKSLDFDEDTGYWTLTVEVLSASEVSPYPFLLEKAVPGNVGENTLLNTPYSGRYLRTLLESEGGPTKREDSDIVYDTYTWVQYVSNKFTKSFYTYETASDALNAVMSVLKSNANIYTTDVAKPQLVITNLSSKDKAPALKEVSLTKGDTLSIQLVNGPRETSIVTDANYIPVIAEADSTSTRSVNSFVVTITGVDDATYIGVRDNFTGQEYVSAIQVLPTPLEGSSTEIIK